MTKSSWKLCANYPFAWELGTWGAGKPTSAIGLDCLLSWADSPLLLILILALILKRPLKSFLFCLVLEGMQHLARLLQKKKK